MNYLKRIEIKRRPQHFQQGGNIAIGSPKPYTTTLPGVNFNPLTLNNAPIEINTTGITDQINKMRQLAFDREALAFKYKELEYKEGADYLDLLGEITKTINGVSTTVKSAGGVSAISPRFKDILSQQQSEKAKLLEEISRAGNVKDFKARESLIAKAGQLYSNPKYLEAQTLAGVIDGIIENSAKDDGYGIGTKVILDGALRYLQGDDKVDIYKLIADANNFKALKISAKDETTFINNFLKPVYDKLAEKQVVTIDPKTGIKKTTTTKEKPDITKVKAALKNSLITMQEGKAFLQARNINPDNPTSTDLDTFVNTIVDAYDTTQAGNFAPSIEEGVVEKLLPSYADTPEGKASGANKGRAPSEADENAEAFLIRINNEYGYDAKNKMEGIIKSLINDAPAGEKWSRIEKKLIEDGFQRLDGKSPTGVEEEYKGQTTGLVPYDMTDVEIVNLLDDAESVKTTTDKVVVKEKDGKRYLITDSPEAKEAIRKLWPKTKVVEENQDDDVVWKEYGIDPTREDLSGSIGRPNPLFPLSPLPLFGGNEKNTTIFEIENKPKKTLSTYKGSNVDPVEAAKQLNSASASGDGANKKSVISKYYQD